MEDKNFEHFKKMINGESSTLHIQEVKPAQQVNHSQSEKDSRNKEKLNPVLRQLNVEVSELTFIKLKTRAVEERVALRKLVEEAILFYLNRK